VEGIGDAGHDGHCAGLFAGLDFRQISGADLCRVRQLDGLHAPALAPEFSRDHIGQAQRFIADQQVLRTRGHFGQTGARSRRVGLALKGFKLGQGQHRKRGARDINGVVFHFVSPSSSAAAGPLIINRGAGADVENDDLAGRFGEDDARAGKGHALGIIAVKFDDIKVRCVFAVGQNISSQRLVRGPVKAAKRGGCCWDETVIAGIF